MGPRQGEMAACFHVCALTGERRTLTGRVSLNGWEMRVQPKGGTDLASRTEAAGGKCKRRQGDDSANSYLAGFLSW